MIDTSTRFGRFLAQLKFCAVSLRDSDGQDFVATRCFDACGRFRDDAEGVDGSTVDVAAIDSCGNVLGFAEVDFDHVLEFSITPICGRFYLDGRRTE